MKRILVFLLLISAVPVFAQQKVQVPDNIYFAGMHLKLTRDAQDEIQKHVDYLMAYPSYLQAKVDRADTYFPIIERVFKEEGLPDDFKYLVLQESGLVSDAVSTSNAVGFWQFKREAASDFGLAVNQQVDERKHIVESTRGAARYLLKHNMYLNNWAVTLLSYNLGLTGVRSTPEAKYIGKNSMPIEKNTHIYIQKFIAHKLAFENYVGRNSTPAISLKEHQVNGGGTLFDIAQAYKVDVAEVERYNKWLIGSSIPSNKAYTVILPFAAGTDAPVTSSVAVPVAQAPAPKSAPGMAPATFTTLNGLRAIVAREGDTKDRLAMQAGMSTRKFLRINDMETFEPVVAGAAYYVQDKKNAADVEFYVAAEGETMHGIAQKFGVKERSLRAKNHMKKHEVLIAGRKLWMQKIRPRHTPAEYVRPEQEQPKPYQRVDLYARKPSGSAAPAPATVVTTAATPAAAPVKPAATPVQAAKHTEAPPASPAPVALYPSAASAAAPAKSTPEPSAPAADSAEAAEPATGTAAADDTAGASVISTDSAPFDLSSLDEPAAAEPEPVAVYEPVAAAAPALKKEPAPVREEPGPVAAATPAPVRTAPAAAPAPVKPAPAAPAPAVTKPAAPAAAAPKALEHVVEKGETMYSISRRYNTSPEQLQQYNNLSGNSLSIGQKLLIPDGSPAPAKPAPASAAPAASAPAPSPAAPSAPSAGKHVVQPGETMYQIARKHGITVIDLMDWNNRTDTNLKPGESLVVKK